MRKVKQKRRIQKYCAKRSRIGLGLFATAPIKKGRFVIEYTGKLITDDEADQKGGKYLFSVNPRWVIDGTERENLSRYINHSCRPNCEPWIDGRKIKIYALKNIQPGEELAYDYGKEYFEEYIKPHGCCCKRCRKR